jgi:hypothetical protein
MRFFVKAVVSGFAFSLGAALFKKVSNKMGLDEPDKKAEGPVDTNADGEASPT